MWHVIGSYSYMQGIGYAREQAVWGRWSRLSHLMVKGQHHNCARGGMYVSATHHGGSCLNLEYE